MNQRIKFPGRCSNEELAEVLAMDSRFFIDFPYSPGEGRMLTMADYQAEKLLRDNKAAAPQKAKPGKPTLVQYFMDRLRLLNPALHAELELAAKACRRSSKPTGLALMPDDLSSRSYIAHMSLRSAVFQFTGCKLVGTDVSHFWLLPPEHDDVRGWVQKNGGFPSAKAVEKRFPRASAALQLVAKEAIGRSDRYAVLEIHDSDALRELVDVLSVYANLTPFEELHRVIFALGYGNKVAARHVAACSSKYTEFISPAAQLKAWELGFTESAN